MIPLLLSIAAAIGVIGATAAILRTGMRGICVAVMGLGAAGTILAAWPDARRPLDAVFAEPAPVENTMTVSTMPASATAFSTGSLVRRLPPDHPDPSAPRNGPHFTCHENNAR